MPLEVLELLYLSLPSPINSLELPLVYSQSRLLLCPSGLFSERTKFATSLESIVTRALSVVACALQDLLSVCSRFFLQMAENFHSQAR
ncbi:Hypothetical protein, putative [Bodo saltans]|uniref:Uncharacterized protein n=1 Tax=Bodo saltans TaxID=75058 RepID=A0A0S4KHG5_BODSA|nr:Hypothetical protein, putative [Bodo saltans]|eukprot:CUI11640.1 Hypothetical protein, putative [Bodo saltans]